MTAPTVSADLADPEGFPPPDPPTDDPAPWGRRADGTPRAKPGRRAGRSSGRSSGGGKATPPPKKATSGRKPPPKRPDYRAGITALLSLPVGLLGAAGATLQRPELVADAATLATGAPEVAGALDQLAGDDPRVAAVLDWVLSAGPYGALVGAVLPMAAQVACNHGIIRPGMLGTRDPAELMADFARQRGHSPNGATGGSPDDPAG